MSVAVSDLNLFVLLPQQTLALETVRDSHAVDKQLDHTAHKRKTGTLPCASNQTEAISTVTARDVARTCLEPSAVKCC